MARKVTKTIIKEEIRSASPSRKRSTSHSRKRVSSNLASKGLEKSIAENLIQLQKVHTNLAEKFDKLASEISQLLSLFELAARSFAKHPAIKATEKDHEFLEKIDKLLDQNKTIAKGLTLMEERIRERLYGPEPEERSVPEVPKPAREVEEVQEGNFQPSVARRPQEIP